MHKIFEILRHGGSVIQNFFAINRSHDKNFHFCHMAYEFMGKKPLA